MGHGVWNGRKYGNELVFTSTEWMYVGGNMTDYSEKDS